MQIIGFDSQVEVEVTGPEQILPGALFVAHVRERVNASAILATLSTASGTIEVVSSVANVAPEPGYEFTTLFVLTFLGTVTKDWPTTKVVTDMARVDVAPDEYLGFQLSIDFVQPVTRI